MKIRYALRYISVPAVATSLRMAAIATFLVLCATLLPVAAQQSDDRDVAHDHVGAGSCGYQHALGIDNEAMVRETLRRDPHFFARMAADVEKRREAELFAARGVMPAITYPFYARDRTNNNFVTIRAELRYGISTDDNRDTTTILIWVAINDTAEMKPSSNVRITDATIRALAEGLLRRVKPGSITRNADTGLIYNDIAIFGPPPPNKIFENHIVSFLLMDIDDGRLSGGNIGGYFDPYDQTDLVGSNGMNLLYIDTWPNLHAQTPGAIESTIGTIAHEFQHLINDNRFKGDNTPTQRFINEGLSEVASLRNGYFDRRSNEYLRVIENINVKLFDWPDTDDGYVILRAYERAMAFVWYMYERYGDPILYNLVSAPGEGSDKVKNAMEMTGVGSDWQAVMRGYYVASLIQNDQTFSGQDRYTFNFPLSTTSAATVRKTFPAIGESRPESVSLAPFGGYYANYFVNRQSFKVRFTSRQNREFGIEAVVQRASGIEVRELNPNQDYTFEDRNIINVTFVLTSLHGDNQNIDWTIDALVSDVPSTGDNRPQLELVSIAPNPSAGPTHILLRTDGRSALRLELFDLFGRRVRAIIDGERLETGEHVIDLDPGDLPNGVYMVRLGDGAAMAVERPVVLAR